MLLAAPHLGRIRAKAGRLCRPSLRHQRGRDPIRIRPRPDQDLAASRRGRDPRDVATTIRLRPASIVIRAVAMAMARTLCIPRSRTGT